MKTSYATLLAVLSLLVWPSFANRATAQPPSSRGGEDRGGERGSYGGERGSDRGSYGGDRGSWSRDRGSDQGSDRGSWSRNGPPGGGPPSGGFPGGGPPSGGYSRGGPPGGGFSGGGPPSGGAPSSGAPGSSRGGFDPSSFIERLDRNGNGMIDTDEMEGPAQMMISRLQRDDPSIRTDRPIPISKLKEAFDRMRGGDSGGSRDSSSSSRDSSRGDTSAKLLEAMTPAPLVPGFGEPKALEPVLGFGPSAELMSVAVTPADLKEAEERLQRYDRNKDGTLSGDEISSRWSGNPLDFDRNGDGKLSVSELAVRAARLRVAQVDVRASENRRGEDRRRDRGDRPVEMPDPYNGRTSFASTSRGLPEGLPGFFTERDLDGDRQVSMAEFARQWTPSLVEEFQSYDLNADGFITVQECLAATRAGATASASSNTAAAPGNSTGSRSSYGSRSGSSSSRSPGSGGSAATSAGPPDQKTMDYAQRIISRSDKNADGVLTPDEWKEMLMDPSAADADKDGRITALEYAQWMQLRSAR